MESMELTVCSTKKSGFFKTVLETVMYAHKLLIFAQVVALTGRLAKLAIFLKTINAFRRAKQGFLEMEHISVKHASSLALSALLEQIFALCVISNMQNL